MRLGTLNLTLPNGHFIKIGNGSGNIEADLDIKSPEFFKRCVLYGDVGFGESYMEGEWQTNNITELIKWFVLNIENVPSVSGATKKKSHTQHS